MSETTTDEERAALRDTSEKIAELLMDRHDLTDARKAHAAALTPLDVGKLKEALASLVEEAKANDPKALRARIAELERAAGKPGPASNRVEKIDMASIKAARTEGFNAGFAKGTETAIRDLAKAASQARRSAQDALSSVEALTLRIRASASRIAPAAPAKLRRSAD